MRVRRSVRELWLPPSRTRATLTQPRQDYTRTGTRKSEHPSALSPFVRLASSTCARFIPRELHDGKGFVGLEKISEKTSRERGGKKIARAITLPLCFVSAGKHRTIQRVNEFFFRRKRNFSFFFFFVRFLLCKIIFFFLFFFF